MHLEGMHIACLCGPNGHGKSSLLEAIAWALWGDAVHRPQEELIHLSEPEMRVELEFLARGDRYRVIRRHARRRGARQGSTSLELYIAMSTNGDGDERDASPSEWTGYRPVSGNSVRETEAIIRRLVGMDYTTFINSAFLLQGRADEFTTKPPTDRKRVLGEILGLGLYDRLQERARGKVRAYADTIQQVLVELKAWEEATSHLPEHQEELPRVKAELKTKFDALETIGSDVGSLRLKREQLRSRAQELSEVEVRVASWGQELKELKERLARTQQRIGFRELLVDDGEKISLSYNRLKSLRTEEESLARLMVPYNRLQERKEMLEQRVSTLPRLEENRETTRSQLEQLQPSDHVLQGRREKLEETVAKVTSMKVENQKLRTEMDALKSKVDALGAGEEQCPLCGTSLGVNGKSHIVSEYEIQGKLLADNYRLNEVSLKELEPPLGKLQQEIAKEEKEFTLMDRELHGVLASLNREIDQGAEATTEIADLQLELDSLGYDPEPHKNIRNEIKVLLVVEEKYRLFQDALQNLPQDKQDLEREMHLVERREVEADQAAGRAKAIREEILELPALEERLLALEKQYGISREEYSQLQGRQVYLEERVRESQDIEIKRGDGVRKLKELEEERATYEQLDVAFGKRGIQAMLIEAAMPELQAEANNLLSRMTEGTMNLRLETLRETHKGEIAETLQIRVADELGERSYETFSGGEAFRINLALRIALSRLLARRSGASLPTLFIDEGFGTQDSAGRDHILGVVQAIAEDFQCIIVITHMDEIKDSFPNRIEVHKASQGSSFSVS